MKSLPLSVLLTTLAVSTGAAAPPLGGAKGHRPARRPCGARGASRGGGQARATAGPALPPAALRPRRGQAGLTDAARAPARHPDFAAPTTSGAGGGRAVPDGGPARPETAPGGRARGR